VFLINFGHEFFSEQNSIEVLDWKKYYLNEKNIDVNERFGKQSLQKSIATKSRTRPSRHLSGYVQAIHLSGYGGGIVCSMEGRRQALFHDKKKRNKKNGCFEQLWWDATPNGE
jgi:hypothetical protein